MVSEKRDAFAPQYEKMDPGELYGYEMMTEYRQCLDEGLDVGRYKSRFEAVEAMPPCAQREALADELFELIRELPTRSDYAYREPSDLEGILALRDGQAAKALPAPDVSYDKLAGAWYGRIAGCLLGKTLEGIRSQELLTLLQGSRNYPMHRYVCSDDATPQMLETFQFDLRHRVYADRILRAPADDDTNYTVMAQQIIEKYGRDFTPDDVAQTWLNSQPKSAYFTAERTAYLNVLRGIFPPESALYKNKYREYIGAQIRADYYGYICPGDPQSAAAMAFRDASVSHVKNGVYGAMYVAAMLAAAATADDAEQVVRQGLSQIPRTSRLYACLQQALRDWEQGIDRSQQIERLHAQFDEHTGYGWCHVISNALIVTLSLLYGAGDFSASVCLAVQSAFDTDCNGATVGSVVGMLRGASAIPDEWKAPLGGTLDTELVRVGAVPIETLIETTRRHIRSREK